MLSKLKLSVIAVFISFLFLSGCTSEITVPLSVNSMPLESKSTLIFYHEDGCILGACDIFINDQMVGKVTPRKPFKTDIESGQHKLYVDPNILRGALVRRVSTQTFGLLSKNMAGKRDVG